MNDNVQIPLAFIQALRSSLQGVLDEALWTLGGRHRCLWAKHKPATEAISPQGFKAQLWVALQKKSGKFRCTFEIEEEEEQGTVPPAMKELRIILADSIRTVISRHTLTDGLKLSKDSTVARVMLSTNVHHFSKSDLHDDIDRVKRFCLSMDYILQEWLQSRDGAAIAALADSPGAYIAAGQVVNDAPRQFDPMLRCEIEKAAVKETIARFKKDDYRVYSQEKDNVGWDLVALRGDEQLLLEVKGLSGNVLCVELTPNEYEQLRARRNSYRVCVVTTALTNPQLAIFSYRPESNTWQDDQKRTLRIKELTAARCQMV